MGCFNTCKCGNLKEMNKQICKECETKIIEENEVINYDLCGRYRNTRIRRN